MVRGGKALGNEEHPAVLENEDGGASLQPKSPWPSYLPLSMRTTLLSDTGERQTWRLSQMERATHRRKRSLE